MKVCLLLKCGLVKILADCVHRQGILSGLNRVLDAPWVRARKRASKICISSFTLTHESVTGLVIHDKFHAWNIYLRAVTEKDTASWRGRMRWAHKTYPEDHSMHVFIGAVVSHAARRVGVIYLCV